MESLDLNGLEKSLPASNFEKAEKELLNNFKAAALSITTLYRSSRNASKRAYNAGYAAACQDLMVMIQQGVSAGGIAPSVSDNPHSGQMTIGRILDWIEARMDAVKAREEEEDEDEEREKEKERGRVAPSSRTDTNKDNITSISFRSGAPQKPSQSASTSYRPADQINAPTPLTPHSPLSTGANISQPPSSPSPTIMARSVHHPFPTTRSAKTRTCSRKDLTDAASNPPTSMPLISENIVRVPSVTPLSADDISAGAKRRHTVMMMLDSTASPAVVDVPSGSSATSSLSSASGNPRRRTRSQRSVGHVQMQAQSLANDPMDIEDDGRERKRVARR
ncbi:hypothetical protein ID866_4186 [Astraeus odoratus]|nr:hypothetical protein ID866_4186 [Astraeus odoratus]